MHPLAFRETSLKDTVVAASRDISNYLNIALGSCGEFHSSSVGFMTANQITEKEHEQLDQLHYKVENELLKLIESLKKKQQDGKWEDSFLCR